MALFNRPDAGSTPVSYPVPTWSACRGIFDAIARMRHAYVNPTHVEVCAPIRYDHYSTNYGGPLRKLSQIKDDDNYQLKAVVLVDVCYKIHGTVQGHYDEPDAIHREHALCEAIERRLTKGQTLYTPCLGWKEFAPSYLGPPRDSTTREEGVNLLIPSLLHSVFDRPKMGRRLPFFHQNVEVTNGLLEFEERPHAQ